MTLLLDAAVFDDLEGQVDIVPYQFRFEPLFEAMVALGDDIASSDVRFVTGVNCLHRLLLFLSGKRNKKFRIDVEIIGKNVFLSRWEKDRATLARATFSSGNGKGFEQACTAKHNAERGISTFHRIVSYQLGGLSFLVQHEVDACGGNCAKVAMEHDTVPEPESREEYPWSLNLEQRMKTDGPGTLRVTKSGARHTSSCLVEIKSRAHNNTDLDDVLGQLWLSRSHNLLLGRHVKGEFPSDSVKEENMTVQIEQWQRDNDQAIAGLIKLLRKVQEILVDARDVEGHSRYAIVHKGGIDKTQLQLYRRQGGQDMIPTHLWSLINS
nr:uncharacterized protein LOC112014083 [Quercus suber]POE48323.1 hypothetical protein CFP56_78613 [Quercus suber]